MKFWLGEVLLRNSPSEYLTSPSHNFINIGPLPTFRSHRHLSLSTTYIHTTHPIRFYIGINLDNSTKQSNHGRLPLLLAPHRPLQAPCTPPIQSPPTVLPYSRYNRHELGSNIIHQTRPTPLPVSSTLKFYHTHKPNSQTTTRHRSQDRAEVLAMPP